MQDNGYALLANCLLAMYFLSGYKVVLGFFVLFLSLLFYEVSEST